MAIKAKRYSGEDYKVYEFAQLYYWKMRDNYWDYRGRLYECGELRDYLKLQKKWKNWYD